MTFLDFLILLGKLGGVWAFVAGFKTWIYEPVRNLSRKFDQMETDIRGVKQAVEHSGPGLSASNIAELRDLLHVMTERQRIFMHDDDRGIFETNAQGETVYVNQRYCNLVGRTTHESMGFGWKSFVCEDDRDQVTREWSSCVREGREFAMNYRYKLPDGRLLEVEVRAMVMRGGGKNKKCIGHIGFVIPVQYTQDEPKTKRLI